MRPKKTLIALIPVGTPGAPALYEAGVGLPRQRKRDHGRVTLLLQLCTRASRIYVVSARLMQFVLIPILLKQ